MSDSNTFFMSHTLQIDSLLSEFDKSSRESFKRAVQLYYYLFNFRKIMLCIWNLLL